MDAITCDWPDCPHCAAVRAFVEKLQQGEIEQSPRITSAWWESAEADRFYLRGVRQPERHCLAWSEWVRAAS
jgi:hypothetical protein